jgi:hypothetical protein
MIGHGVSDSDLGRRLRDLGTHLAVPQTPPLVEAVRMRIAAWQAPVPPARVGWRRRPAILVATLAALAAVLLGSVPTTRNAIAGWLGLRGVTIQQVPTPPTTTTRPTTSPLPIGIRLGLGTPSTLADVRTHVSFAVVVPATLGAPDQVYLREPPVGGAVSLVYLPRAGLPPAAGTGVGLLVTEFRGDLASEFIGKFLGPGTTAEPVTVSGGAGWWISGAPHTLLYRDANGETVEETVRLAGPTLVWERGNVTLRIEGSLTKAQAMAIARSMS